MTLQSKIIEKDIRVENLMELWTTNVCEKVMRDYLGALIGNFDKTQSAIREEERAKCRGLMEECKGEMEKVYEEKARVASPDNSDYMFSLAQFNRVAGVNQGVSTCISILEDKLKLQ